MSQPDGHSPRNRNRSDTQMWVIASLTGGLRTKAKHAEFNLVEFGWHLIGL